MILFIRNLIYDYTKMIFMKTYRAAFRKKSGKQTRFFGNVEKINVKFWLLSVKDNE